MSPIAERMKLIVECPEKHDESDDVVYGQVNIKLMDGQDEITRIEFFPEISYDFSQAISELTLDVVRGRYYAHVCNGGLSLKYDAVDGDDHDDDDGWLSV